MKKTAGSISQLFLSGWKKYLFLLVLYLFLKSIINPEPLLYINGGEINTGIFNFYKRDITLSQDGFNIMPVMNYSAFSTDISGDHPLPPCARDQHGKIHLMGTDQLGRDVFAGFVSGLEIAMVLAIFTGILAWILSVSSGSLAAYFNLRRIKTGLIQKIIFYLILAGAIISALWYIAGMSHVTGLILSILILTAYLFYLAKYSHSAKYKYEIKINSWPEKIYSVIQPVPDLILVIVIAAIFPAMNLAGLILLFALLRWSSGAVYFSNVLSPALSADHIKSALTQGMSGMRLIIRHLVPQAGHLAGIFIAMTGVRAVLAESTLSFIGVGPTSDYVTWGSMIREGLTVSGQWWMVFFPVVGLLGLMGLIRRLAGRRF